MTVADLLVGGLEIPEFVGSECPEGTRCVVTGERITSGVPSGEVITSATTEFLDGFRGGVDGWVSIGAARCFRSAAPKLGNPCGKSTLAFEDRAAWQPLINAESAVKQGRPYWSAVARDVWPAHAGQRCFCLLTVDTKKRLWHKGRVGILGPGMVAYIHDGDVSMNAMLSWPEMLRCLDAVEQTYTLGWSKRAIERGLYSQHTQVESVGIREARRLERMIVAWRGTNEMRFALLIAQRGDRA
jgi:hypothetical protein